MCGIAGIIYKDKANIPEKNLLSEMAEIMDHRGPDGKGFHIMDNVGFSHARLSIIDINNGSQPMISTDKKNMISFNGEIYNYRELKKELSGYDFRTNSDTEVILAAYEKFGLNFLEKLNGMFALALYDSEKKRIIIARDRAGIKPLFFFRDDEKFIFASELKVIRRILGKKCRINKLKLGEYFRFGYIAAPETIYDNVKKLMPSYSIVLNENFRIDEFSYWKILKSDEKTDVSREKFLEIFEDSVRQRLVSDVPVGAFLSGGIDSSAIVAMMSRFRDDVKTFSIGFNEEEYNELPYSNLVSEKYGTNHITENVMINGFETLDKLVGYIDEPMSDPSIIPTWHVCRLASEHVKVVLSGDGADELFGGYDRYKFALLSYRFKKLLGRKNIENLNRFTGLFPDFLRNSYKLNRIEKFLEFNNRKLDSYFGSVEYFSSDEIHDFTEINEESDLYDSLNRVYLREDEYLEEILKEDYKNYLANDILVKLDRMSMAVSLEGRVPFLDHRIIEFAADLSVNEKIQNLTLKKFLKEAFKEILPEDIIKRKKMGFAIPLKEWFSGLYYDELSENLLMNDSPVLNYMEKKYIETLLIDHKRMKKNNSFKLYNLFLLNKWFKNL